MNIVRQEIASNDWKSSITALDTEGRRIGTNLTDHEVRVRLACEELVMITYRWADEGRRADVADLFVDDGSIELGGHLMQGRDTIRTALRARDEGVHRRTHHVVTNFEFRLASPDRAVTRVALLVYALSGADEHELAPRCVAVSEDHLVLGEDGGWRFAKRVTTLLAGEA